MVEPRPVLILYIEDDPAHAEFFMRAIKKTGTYCTIVHLSDGQQALDYLFRKCSYDGADHPDPDIILVDLRLPKVDGFEVVRAIKDDPVLMRIPTIVLTTSESESDMLRMYSTHANSYLVKPLNINDYISMIESFASYWVKWNKSPLCH